MYIVYSIIEKGFIKYTDIDLISIQEVLDIYDYLTFKNDVEVKQWQNK